MHTHHITDISSVFPSKAIEREGKASSMEKSESATTDFKDKMQRIEKQTLQETKTSTQEPEPSGERAAQVNSTSSHVAVNKEAGEEMQAMVDPLKDALSDGDYALVVGGIVVSERVETLGISTLADVNFSTLVAEPPLLAELTPTEELIAAVLGGGASLVETTPVVAPVVDSVTISQGLTAAEAITLSQVVQGDILAKKPSSFLAEQPATALTTLGPITSSAIQHPSPINPMVLEFAPIASMSDMSMSSSALAQWAGKASAESTTPLILAAGAPLVESDASSLSAANPLLKTWAAEAQVTPQLALGTSFQQAKWGEAVTERVMWMSAKGIKTATIQLDPPELGSLHIKVSINQDQAQVSFTVQNASVREALDQNALRLREMFAEDGLNLADVDVSDQSQSEKEQRHEQDVFRSHTLTSEEEMLETPTQSSNISSSLIDSYA
ncbi:MAG: hypothetical protein ACI9D5_002792 [Candidatus Endobugula sp.]|jgi:hypothetical protein